MQQLAKIIFGAAGVIMVFLLGRSAAKTRVLFFGVPMPTEESNVPVEEPVVPVAEPTAPPATQLAEPAVHTTVLTTGWHEHPSVVSSALAWMAAMAVSLLVGLALMAMLVIVLWDRDNDTDEVVGLREEISALQTDKDALEQRNVDLDRRYAVLAERHRLMIGACADTFPVITSNATSPSTATLTPTSTSQATPSTATLTPTVASTPSPTLVSTATSTPRPEYIRALRVINGELVYAACISSSAVLDGRITGP